MIKTLPEMASNQCSTQSNLKCKKLSSRLGCLEKKLLIGLHYFQFTIPLYEKLSAKNFAYYCQMFSGSESIIKLLKTDNSEKELKELIESMNSNYRTVFSRTINRLHEKGFICKLEPSETNFEKFTAKDSRPFIYGRGKYQKLISLTDKGAKKARILKSIKDKELQEARKKRELYWKRQQQYLNKKAKNIK